MTKFHDLYTATAEGVKKLKEPFVADKLKRQFDSAISDAEEQKVDLELKLQSMQENISDYDLNEYLQIKVGIEAAENTAELLKEHKEELFGK